MRIYIIVQILFLLISGCSTPLLTGGSGTEVSAVAGSVVTSDGAPVKNALVRLRPVSFLSDSLRSASYCASHSILDTFTDADGKFSFSKIMYDDYAVEVVHTDSFGSARQIRIDEESPRDTLEEIIVVPMSKLSGNVNIYYPDTALSVVVQVYGIDRRVFADAQGGFSMTLPAGMHTFHIAAYSKDDTARVFESDRVDMSLKLLPGENREAGSFYLRTPPPCPDGRCDSMVVRFILYDSGNRSVPLSSVIKTDSSGRITELNFRGLDFSRGIFFDIVKLSELRVLDISKTGLPNMFPNIGKMTNLEVVRADSNNLTFFSSTIGSCLKLKELDLSNNQLIDLPFSLVNCSSLEVLHVEGNNLCMVSTVMSGFLDIYNKQWRLSQLCL